MVDEELKQFVLNNCFTKRNQLNGNLNSLKWWNERNLTEWYHRIKRETSFLPNDTRMRRRIYHILRELSCVPKCAHCKENEVSWYRDERYLVYCSTSCSVKATLSVREETSLKKHGVRNPAQSQVIIDRIKDRCIDRYGVTNYSLTKEFSEFAKTIFKSKSKEEQEQILGKRRQTCQEKYNANSPVEADEIKEKIKKTLVERYGVERPLQHPSIRKKQEQTTQERFGRPSWKQQHLSLDSIELLRDKSRIEKQLETMSATELADLTGVSHSHIFAILRKHKIDIKRLSSFQEEMINFIKSVYIGKIEIDNNTILNGKHIDIFIPDLKIGIECNGVYWHSEVNGRKDRQYHLNKTLLAEKKGIKLFHVQENEWRLKKEIVKSILCLLLSLDNLKTIDAGACFVKLLPKDEEKEFFEGNSLNGYIKSKLSIGLFFEGSLVAAASFNPSKSKKENSWEVVQYCQASNKNVVSGFEQVTSFFFENVGVPVLKIHIDRRLPLVSHLEKTNYEFLGATPPSCLFWREHSFILKTEKEALETLSLEEKANKEKSTILLENGFDRIWDCGKLTFNVVNKNKT